MAEIKDFGKKIGGARKDLWKTYGLSLDDIQNLNEAEQKTYIKRDYIWPTPDAKKLVEEGKTPWFSGSGKSEKQSGKKQLSFQIMNRKMS